MIHNYLKELPHIRNESEGEGRARRIRIMYDEDKK